MSTNVQTKAPTHLVSAWLPEDLHSFFNNLRLRHGWRQQFIEQFFTKLHAAAVAAGVTSTLDPENEVLLRSVLAKLNFTGKKPKAKK